MTGTPLTAFLADHPPFDALGDEALETVARGAHVVRGSAGETLVDGFAEPTSGLYAVLEGRVGLWNTMDAIGGDPQEILTPGGVFGYSAMLTQRPIGPRAIALTDVQIAFIPAEHLTQAFTSSSGARFLAEQIALSHRGPVCDPSYGIVDDLIVNEPIIARPVTPVDQIAREMTIRGVDYAVVPLDTGDYGVITDAVLRKRILVDGLPSTTPASEVMIHPAPTTRTGESAAGALIALLDHGAEFILVLDHSNKVIGAVTPSDFAVSTSTADVELRQQLAQAPSLDDLITRAGRMPAMVEDLLARGLATSKVTSVYTATVDAVVRRALVLTFARHRNLDIDAFTFLALGSIGRGEAVLSSDVDSAVAFRGNPKPEQQQEYCAAFAELNQTLTEAGLNIDAHGATAAREPFARSSTGWRQAGREWLADPVANQGAIMTSLMVDARPIHGDPGLPQVARVFGELRQHPGTMRLLLTESLSARARLRSTKDVLIRRGGTFDIKAHALVPVVNIARWAALAAGSPALSTTERLRAAAGGLMMPDDQARDLIEVFEVLQRIRLRHQLIQVQRGARPSDILTMHVLSPIDRSIISQAVREIRAVQHRMASKSQYVPPEEWAAPSPE